MFSADQISQHRQKLGYYIMDGKTYTNKYQALENMTEHSRLNYYFNDDAFGQCDFTQEPAENMYELYRQRAQQLRDKYEYLVLYFSGGIDSTTVLRTFIDNNIPLDGIVMYGTWEVKRGPNKSALNLGPGHLDTAEQDRAGIPYLQELQRRHNNKLNIHFLDTTKYYSEFQDPDWVYACNTYLGPRIFMHNFYWNDPWMQQWMYKGNTAFIRAIDKPRVVLDEGWWKMGFLDVQCIDSTPSGIYNKHEDHAINEYFFWTPDFPKLMVKQCHEIVKYFENQLPESVFHHVTTKTAGFNGGLYYRYVDPVIYGRYCGQKPGEDKAYFSLEKSISPVLMQKDKWFYHSTKNDLEREYKVWQEGIKRLQKNINPKHFNPARDLFNGPDYNDTMTKLWKEFNLNGIDIPELGERHVLFGTTGYWSRMHKIKSFSKFKQ